MSLKKKILLGYGFMMGIMAIAIAWSIWHLILLSDASSEILRENYRSIIAAENMIDSIERQDSGILLAVIGYLDEGRQQFRDNELTFLKWLARAKDNITINGEAETLKTIEIGYSAFRNAYLDLLESIERDRTDPLQHGERYKLHLLKLFYHVRVACENLRKMNEETMYAASLKASSVGRNAIFSTGIVAALVLLLSLILGSIVVEKIVSPLRNFVSASRKIASGDYDIQIENPVDVAAEIALLSDEFNLMASQLRAYDKMNIEKILEEKGKIEAVIASIEDGLIVLSQELKIAGINLAARQILGYEFSDCINADYKEILPEKICRVLDDKNQLFKDSDKNEAEKNLLTINRGEKTRHFLFSITMIRSKKEDAPGYVILFKDVTKLREVEQLKDEFLSAVSHELRTPLTSMKMSLALLKERAVEKLQPKDQELLEIADEEIARLKSLVDDLLDLSKIESGKIEMDFTRVELKPLIQHAVKVFQGQLETKSVAIETEWDQRIGSVRADANKITWVLTNLISNALRYVPDHGKIRVEVEKNGDFATCMVEDNGPGIPLEFQSRIFEKFIRADSDKPGGTGLGLAICREIVRAHGGSIWLESAKDKGSRFYFTIPLF